MPIKTERIQRPEQGQMTKQPSAVIVKGNPAYITGNKHAAKFYNDLASHVRSQGYSVTFDPGEPYTSPPPAELWIGHSRGIDRLRFAPKGTKTVALGGPKGISGVINHPLDNPQVGVTPTVFHYLLTDEMKQGVTKKMEKQANISPEMALSILGGVGGTGLGGLTGMLAGGKGKRIKGGLIGAGIGGAAGAGLGYLGGRQIADFAGTNIPMNPLIEESKAKQLVGNIINRQETTPRELDNAAFGDLDQRIQQASKYRAENTDLNYKQDFSMFDKKVPVYTQDTAPSKLRPIVESKFDTNPNLAGFYYSKGPQNGVSGWLNKAISSAPTEWAALRDNPEMSANELFSTLNHEVKGHGTQLMQASTAPAAAQSISPQISDATTQQRFKYLTDPRELERRIQATHDWSAKNLGYRAKTPEEFGKVLNQAPKYDDMGLSGANINGAGHGDVADIPTMLKNLKSKGINTQQLEEYIKRLAPGIVQNQQANNIPKTAELLGGLYLSK